MHLRGEVWEDPVNPKTAIIRDRCWAPSPNNTSQYRPNLHLCYLVDHCEGPTSTQPGEASSVCPESKKLYPGDCRLFYKCVPLSEDSAQAYVWVPSRCTAGLVYEPRLQRCVFPREGWNCEKQKHEEDSVRNSFYSLKGSSNAEDVLKMTDYAATSTVRTKEGIYMSGFKDGDDKLAIIKAQPAPYSGFNFDFKNKLLHSKIEIIPLTELNNLDSNQEVINKQMNSLAKLISKLKATSTTSLLNNSFSGGENLQDGRKPPFPIDYSAIQSPILDLTFPQKHDFHPSQELNLLPAQIYKITAQLMSQAPSIIHQANLNLKQPQTSKYPIQTSNTAATQTNYDPNKLVSDLYKKYLTNNTLFNQGEFAKTSIKPSTTANPIKSHCLTGQRIANPKQCNKYYICKNSSTSSDHLIKLSCPPNMAFNKQKGMCDNDEFKRCMLTNNNNNYSKYSNKNVSEDCIHNKEERVEDPSSVNYYYICVKEKGNGRWIKRKVKCPGNLEYCVQKKICLSKAYCHQ